MTTDKDEKNSMNSIKNVKSSTLACKYPSKHSSHSYTTVGTNHKGKLYTSSIKLVIVSKCCGDMTTDFKNIAKSALETLNKYSACLESRKSLLIFVRQKV